ncbi:hypothetical protein OEZ86_003045 [Tetradesmus obliquus]|nr:hypothetical protein OEZ86_003045 [Tetradesmus obliquus]
MEEDAVDQLGGDARLNTHALGDFYLSTSANFSAGDLTCPGCSERVQPGYALNRASCSCGCNFCARCGAVHLNSSDVEQAAAADAAVQEADGQLGLEELLGEQQQQQQQQPMQQDQPGQEEQLSAEQQQQQQQLAGSNASGAVVSDKRGRLQLAGPGAWDEEASSGSRPEAAAAAEVVPQLAALGLLPEAPPVLPDEPVVLLAAAGQEEQPGHARLFW